LLGNKAEVLDAFFPTLTPLFLLGKTPFFLNPLLFDLIIHFYSITSPDHSNLFSVFASLEERQHDRPFPVSFA